MYQASVNVHIVQSMSAPALGIHIAPCILGNRQESCAHNDSAPNYNELAPMDVGKMKIEAGIDATVAWRPTLR